jgi:hypothetical protein
LLADKISREAFRERKEEKKEKGAKKSFQSVEEADQPVVVGWEDQINRGREERGRVKAQ